MEYHREGFSRRFYPISIRIIWNPPASRTPYPLPSLKTGWQRNMECSLVAIYKKQILTWRAPSLTHAPASARIKPAPSSLPGAPAKDNDEWMLAA